MDNNLKKWMIIAEGAIEDGADTSGKVVKNEYGTFYFKSAGNNVDDNGLPIRKNLHRLNGPAALWSSGDEEWFIDGVKCRAQEPNVKEDMIVPKTNKACDCNKWNCYKCFPKDANSCVSTKTLLNTNEDANGYDHTNGDFSETDYERESSISDIMAMQDAGLSNSDRMYTYEELMSCSPEDLDNIMRNVIDGSSTPGSDNMGSDGSKDK